MSWDDIRTAAKALGMEVDPDSLRLLKMKVATGELTDQTIQEAVEKSNLEEKKEKFLELKNEVLQLIAKRDEDSATEKVSEYIKKTEVIYSIKQDKTSEVFFYQDGIMKPNGASLIKEISRKVFGQAYTPQRANKVIAKVEADTYIDADTFFRKAQEFPDEIPVLNGILNVKTLELKEFSPEKIFFSKINSTYNPRADCPEIKKFLDSVLKNKEDKEVIFEIIGSLLYKKIILQVAVMLVGDGENGKGVFESLIRKFVGVESCSSVPLNQLTSDSFSVAELFGKLVNLSGDISNTDLRDTGRFKELTSGTDLITAKRKFLRDLFFVNYAKLIFSCNELPRVYDFSHGFWRRWVLIEFPYTFLKQKEFDLREDKTNIKLANPDIIEKISTSEELSGLLNEALKGLKRILEKKQFSFSRSVAEVKDFWIRKSDSFTAFCFDCLEEDSESHISKKQLRKEFSKYCKRHKIKGAGDKNIKAVLEDLFGVIESRKSKGDDFEREMVWEGIKLKDPVKEVKGFSTYSQFTNTHIGSNTIDTLDTFDKVMKEAQLSEPLDKKNTTLCSKCQQNQAITIIEDKFLCETCSNLMKGGPKE